MSTTPTPTFVELLREHHPQVWSTKERDADVQRALLSGNPYMMRAAALLQVLTSSWRHKEFDDDLLRAKDPATPPQVRDTAIARLTSTTDWNPRATHTVVTLIEEIDKIRPDVACLALQDIYLVWANSNSAVPATIAPDSKFARDLVDRFRPSPRLLDAGRFAADQEPFLTLEEAAAHTLDRTLCELTLRTITQKTFNDGYDVPDRDRCVKIVAARHIALDPEGFIRTAASCCFHPENLASLPIPHCHENPIALFFESLVAPLMLSALRGVRQDRLPAIAALVCNTVQLSLKHDYAERIERNTVRLLVSLLRRVRRQAPEFHAEVRAFVSALKPPSPHRPPPRRLPSALRRELSR